MFSLATIIPTIQKYLIELIAFVVAILFFFGLGYYVEAQRWDQEQIKLTAEYNDQIANVKKENLTLKENASEQETNNSNAVNNIMSYYNGVPEPTCTVNVPGPNSNTKGTNATSSNSNDTAHTETGFISPYSPEQTELIANQLNQLQVLLTRDGVQVK